MNLVDDLLASLPDAEVSDVRIGLHWTAVVATVDGERRCGLASTLAGSHEHGVPDVSEPGLLETYSALELARNIRSNQPTMASVAVAAINALVPRRPECWADENAGEVIARQGAGKTVALVGHFPFIPSVRSQVGELVIIEREPRDGELPEEAAAEVFARASLVAITGMTLVNQSLEPLLELCSPAAEVLILGPSTPLSPVMFDYGINFLSGSIVTDIDAVLRAIGQGGTFRQIHRLGVRLVTMRC